MAILNFSSGIRYSNSGRKRKTKAFRKARNIPSKFEEYTALVEKQEQQYKSLMQEACGKGNPTPRKESPQYTGSLLLGIATMHKSNAVPVSSKEYAIDITNMSK